MSICPTCHMQQPCDCDPTNPPTITTPARTWAERHINHNTRPRIVVPFDVEELAELAGPAKPRSGHPAVLARNDLLTLASTWQLLVNLLPAGSGSDASGVRGTPSSRVLIDVTISDVMREVAGFARQYARAVGASSPVGQVLDVPALILTVADRVGRITEADPSDKFVAETHQLVVHVARTILPSGRRKVPVGLHCEEHDTSPLGERVPCPGFMWTVLDPETPYRRDDLVCSVDTTHRISPDEWQRAYRRTAHDPAATMRLLAAIHTRQAEDKARIR